MKNQALFSSKYKSKKLKCRLLQFLFGALRIKAEKTATFSRLQTQTTSQVNRPALNLTELPVVSLFPEMK